MRIVALFLLLVPAGLCLAGTATAEDDVLRYVSLDTDRAFMRTGPGLRYPVEWVFVREGWPFQVISEYGYWRKVRDIDGTSGWMHRNLLTSKRRVIVTGDVENVYEDKDITTRQVAILEKGVVADLRSCEKDWCEISVRNKQGDYLSGWARRDGLWGTEDAAK